MESAKAPSGRRSRAIRRFAYRFALKSLYAREDEHAMRMAIVEASEELGDAMKGLDIRQMDEKDLLQTRGW